MSTGGSVGFRGADVTASGLWASPMYRRLAVGFVPEGEAPPPSVSIDSTYS